MRTRTTNKKTAQKARAVSSTAPTETALKPQSPATTWWGKRWLEALRNTSREHIDRLGAGRACANAGHVHDLTITPGSVTAQVEDKDEQFYQVSLRIDAFDDATWNNIITQMGQQALFAAQLLTGEMPREIDRAFRLYDCSLFPARQHELDTDCSCADWASPCKHVAATHYFLGQALDQNPFLLFELRGRSREQILQALGQLRGITATPTDTTPVGSEKPDEDTDSILLNELSATPFEQAAAALPNLHFQLHVATDPDAVLQQLGTPANWPNQQTPLELLLPVYTQASKWARELATRTEDSTTPTTPHTNDSTS